MKRLVSVDVIPRSPVREPWTTWRPAGETFWYLRAFTTRRHIIMVGLVRR